MEVLTVLVDDGALPSLLTASLLEETIVLEGIPDLLTAFAYIFGLLYTLNI